MAATTPRYISLFAGCGGLDLAVRIACPPARCVCYVEGDIAAAQLLASRLEDGTLDDAPLWSDVRTFDGLPWRGLVDGIVGGFPCQDLSVAGRQEGIAQGNRSGLWFEFARIIREVRPRWVLVENVPPVLAFPAGGIVLGELAACGFDAEWLPVRASGVGASHGRKRVFLLAYQPGGRRRELRQSSRRTGLADGRHARLADAQGAQWRPDDLDGDLRRERQQADRTPRSGDADVEHAAWDGESRCDGEAWRSGRRRICAPGERVVADAAGEGLEEPLARGWSELPAQDRGRLDDRPEQHGRALADASGSSTERRGESCELGAAQAAELTEGDQRQRNGHAVDDSLGELADASSEGLSERERDELCRARRWSEGRAAQQLRDLPLFAPGPADPIWQDVLVRFPELRPAISHAEAESLVCGMAVRSASRLDRLRAIGNIVVPLQGALALMVLAERAGIDLVSQDEAEEDAA